MFHVMSRTSRAQVLVDRIVVEALLYINRDLTEVFIVFRTTSTIYALNPCTTPLVSCSTQSMLRVAVKVMVTLSSCYALKYEVYVLPVCVFG